MARVFEAKFINAHHQSRNEFICGETSCHFTIYFFKCSFELFDSTKRGFDRRAKPINAGANLPHGMFHTSQIATERVQFPKRVAGASRLLFDCVDSPFIGCSHRRGSLGSYKFKVKKSEILADFRQRGRVLERGWDAFPRFMEADSSLAVDAEFLAVNFKRHAV
jgi:hypothetical protein